MWVVFSSPLLSSLFLLGEMCDYGSRSATIDQSIDSLFKPKNTLDFMLTGGINVLPLVVRQKKNPITHKFLIFERQEKVFLFTATPVVFISS